MDQESWREPVNTGHTLPVPAHLLCRALDTISSTVGPIPVERRKGCVTRDLVAAAMEELNAEATRTLVLAARTASGGAILLDGLDRHLAARGFSADDSAWIAEVLIGSGIAERASVTDRKSRRCVRAVKLGASWTWTIAGEGFGNSLVPAIDGGDGAAASWVSLCPVCRQGRLDPVTGELLYGIPPTDFLACASCGARFVPDNGNFRLVSIAHRRDPEWQKFLNAVRSPAEWRHLAMSGVLPEHAGTHSRDHGRRGSAGKHSGRVMPHTLALETGEKTLYFIRVPVRIIQRNDRDMFKGRRETLRAVLGIPAFARLRNLAESRYGSYLDAPVGYFLSELKARGDGLYRQFLHSYGDKAFCSVRAEESGRLSGRGVYVVTTGTDVIASGASYCLFRETIDSILGNIPPEACYLDGDSDRCRINAILCSAPRHSGLYVHVLSDNEEIARIAAVLSGKRPRPMEDQGLS